jgi:hypothetical protein
LVGCVALLLPLLALAGCSSGNSKVSGRVLYNGAPLPGGRLTFRPADPRRNSVNAVVDAQGNYEAELPVGEVKVCVDNRELMTTESIGADLPPGLPFSAEAKKALGGKPAPVVPAAPAEGDNAPAKPAGRYIPIPSRYYDVDTSGLDFKVEGGSMQHDLTLKP